MFIEDDDNVQGSETGTEHDDGLQEGSESGTGSELESDRASDNEAAPTDNNSSTQPTQTLDEIIDYLVETLSITRFDHLYGNILSLWPAAGAPENMNHVTEALGFFRHFLVPDDNGNEIFECLGRGLLKVPRFEQVGRFLLVVAVNTAHKEKKSESSLMKRLLECAGIEYSEKVDLKKLHKFINTKKQKALKHWDWKLLPLGDPDGKKQTAQVGETECQTIDEANKRIKVADQRIAELERLLKGATSASKLPKSSASKRASSVEPAPPTKQLKSNQAGATKKAQRCQTERAIGAVPADDGHMLDDIKDSNKTTTLRVNQNKFVKEFRNEMKTKDELKKEINTMGPKQDVFKQTRNVFKEILELEDTEAKDYDQATSLVELPQPRPQETVTTYKQLISELYCLWPLCWDTIKWKEVDVEAEPPVVKEMEIPAHLVSFIKEQKIKWGQDENQVVYEQSDKMDTRIAKVLQSDVNLYRLNWIRTFVMNRNIAVTLAYMLMMNVLHVVDGRPSETAQQYLGWTHCAYPNCEAENPHYNWNEKADPSKMLWPCIKVCYEHRNYARIAKKKN